MVRCGGRCFKEIRISDLGGDYMNGRREQELIKENKIQKMLDGQPDILLEYSYSFTSKETTTKKAYIGYIISFLRYIQNEIKLDIYDSNVYKEIKPNHINMFMEYIKYSNGKENGASIIATKLYAVSNFFEFLLDNGYVNNNPCSRIKPPKDNIEKEIIVMNTDEIRMLEHNIKNGVGSHRSRVRNQKWINRDLAIIMLGCSTGLRVSAIVQINLNDIDTKRHKIRVIEKGGIGKNVYIGEKVENQLIKWIEDRSNIMHNDQCQALFISNQKKRMTTESVRQLMKRNTYNIDKNITPHKMRATCATRLYEATGDIYRVQQQLGHKSIKNTERYAKVSEKKKMESANILDSMF